MTTLHERLLEVRNRLLDSGDWGIGWSAIADATVVMEAIEALRQANADLKAVWIETGKGLEGLKRTEVALGITKETHDHVWVEAGPPEAPFRICDECSARETLPDWADQRTCRHQVRKLDCPVCSSAETPGEPWTCAACGRSNLVLQTECGHCPAKRETQAKHPCEHLYSHHSDYRDARICNSCGQVVGSESKIKTDVGIEYRKCFPAETACECRDAFGRHLPSCPVGAAIVAEGMKETKGEQNAKD